IDGHVGGVSNPQPVVLTEASPDWVNGTNGICEACHADGALPHPDSYHPGNHNLDSDCRLCHMNHESSFQPVVQGCNVCHGGEAGPEPDGSIYPDTAGSHAKHVQELDLDCILCHNTPEGPGGEGHFDYIPPADLILRLSDPRIGPEAMFDPVSKTCGVYCHNPGGGEPPAPDPAWGEPTTVFCGSCHAVTPDTLKTGSHATHFDAIRGPGATTCTTCHPDNSVNHSPIDGVVSFLDGKDLLETNACNECHGVTAPSKPEWGGEVGCLECHNSTHPANSMADGSGIEAPVLTNLFWTAGHGLSATETYTFTGNEGAGFSDCLACHEKHPTEGKHISHVIGDESRLRSVPEDSLEYTIKATELCMDCHLPGQNALGTLGYDATSEAHLHSTGLTGHYGTQISASGAFPAYGDESNLAMSPGYQCLDCHNPHGTTNLAMIREEIDGNVGGESNPQTVVFTEQDPRWALGGEGICEACHAPGESVHPDSIHPGNHNIQGDMRGDCRVCHNNHESSFQPDPINCSLCHGDSMSSAPVGSIYPNKDNAHTLHVRELGLDCSLCHNTPEGPGGSGHFDYLEPADVVLDTTNPLVGPGASFDPATLTCSNVYCHNPEGGGATPSPPEWDNPESVYCGSCHSIDLSKSLLGSHSIHADKLRGPGLNDCLTCHPNNAVQHTPIDGIVEFADGHDLESTETCNRCHGTTAAAKPTWGGTVQCIECHKADNPANSMADGSGVFAPERTTTFPIKGHGLPSSQNYAVTGNPGAGLPNCVPCHEDRPTHGQHITHIKGDEKRLRDIPRDSHAFTNRSTEQCLDCHIPGREELGHLGVDASAEAMIHSSAVTGHYGALLSAPEAFPAYGDDSDFETSPGFQCADCHDPHGTSNLAMIRPEIDGKVGGVSNPRAVQLTETSSLWANGNDGVCEACHTSSGLPHPDTNHPGNHNVGSDCRACHSNHGNSFRPLGGSGSCTTCHSSPQNGRRAIVGEFARISHHVIGSVTDSQCIVCHDQSTHMAGTVRLVDYDNPGSSIAFSDALSAEAFCLGCHDSDGADGNFVPFEDGGVAVNVAGTWGASHHKSAGQTCLDCHENNHGSEKRKLLSPADTPATSPSLTEEEEGFCYTCHGAGGPASKNIEVDFALLSHHNVAYADQSADGGRVECTDCHNPHAGNHQKPLIDPDEPHLVWTGNEVDFCLRCHDGAPPAGVIFPSTSPGTGYDKSRFASSTHGLSGSVSCGDCHKAHGSNRESLKTMRYEQSDQVTYSGGGAQYLLCWQCHRENVVVGNEARNAFGTLHDKHVKEKRAPCIECHDPHSGYDSGESGLISFVYPDKHGWNFDLSVGGTNYTLSTAYQDTGTNTGRCYLDCHGERHSPKSYTGQ
ncbi:MAG: CxxxxCH/CxxCH domain-containing protein, partial [Candidatus Omnitrophica bacterium]|nr:CxxxxCH/CxxCH domain-containing protein [Candidatus Omnitrophota bacterium]